MTLKFVTRERPKIDRLACPWLVARFVDANAEFLFVPAGEVLDAAKKHGAIPYDIPDVELSHVGENPHLGKPSYITDVRLNDVHQPSVKNLLELPSSK